MHRFKLSFLALLLLGVLLPLAAGARGQAPPAEALFERAEREWWAGNYIAALEALEELLASESGERFVREVALLTGELFHVDDLSDDGQLPAISPGGRYASYATRGRGAVTRIVDLEDGLRVVAEVPGAHRLSFSPGDTLAVYVSDGGVGQVVPATGAASQISTPGLQVRSAALGAADRLYLVAGGQQQNDVYALERTGAGFQAPVRLTESQGAKTDLVPLPRHGKLLYRVGNSLRVFDLEAREETAFPSVASAVSADGSTLVFSRREQGQIGYYVLDLAGNAEPRRVYRTDATVRNLAVSPRGTRAAFEQMMPAHDWEVFAFETADGTLLRVTDEPQHDYDPHFLSENTLFALKGERRNRRAFYHDLRTGEEFDLFRNNTVRTIAPQYEHHATRDGSKIIIMADRNGRVGTADRTISVTNLARTATREELQERVRAQLAEERGLRERGERMFAPLAAEVRPVTEQVQLENISRYVHGLVDIGSRNIARPGNARAIEYLSELFRSFGYEPELDWFDARGNRTSNVAVTLPGTVNPELVYVMSAHFDTVGNTPGADDNASGTATLLEAARVLKEHPQPATIVFLATTAEESGLLGARRWVEQAAANDVRFMGLLNNDMLGWSPWGRLDNTARYTHRGLGEVQHAAAFLFSGLITYDALFFRTTDATVFSDEYGNLVTGFGNYPILSTPHYHRPSDTADTVNMELITETSRASAAIMMLLASSPAPVRDLAAERRAGGGVEVTWSPSPESGVVDYTVTYGPAEDPEAHTLTVTEPRAALQNAPPGTQVKVRANNQRGLHGWGWAEVTVE